METLLIIALVIAGGWLLALELRHRSLKADNAALIDAIEDKLGVRVKL